MHQAREGTVTVWNQSFIICSHLSKSLDEMYNDAEALEKTMKPNRHKEKGKGRQEVDAEDQAKILRVL